MLVSILNVYIRDIFQHVSLSTTRMIPALLVWVLSVSQYANGFLSNYPISAKEKVFTAKMYENSTSVQLNKDLLDLLSKEGCTVGVNWLFPSQEKMPVPFGYSDGKLVLLADRHIDCEVKRIYDLALNSTCADNQRSTSAKIRLFIADVNEHKPFFSQSIYETRYVEGEGLSYILKVVAYDQDCVNDHRACGYRIITDEVPFQINDDGLIWPTVPLDPKVPKYEFKVVALDCTDGSQSEPADVIVHVEAACKPRFKVDTSQEFNRDYPFQNLLLILCPFCEPVDIVVRISLEFDQPQLLVCSDVYCEDSKQTVENLLESYPHMDYKEPPPRFTYSFNGDDDFLVVENSHFLQSLYGDNFRVKFWMRLTEDPEPKAKRQIICESDTTDLDRHHFSIYVQRGSLKLLKRHQPMPAPAIHEFFPSEWSWNISRFIDEEWHMFDMPVKFPSVDLYVDSSPEPLKLDKVVNGWPLAAIYADENPKTNLTIGACWHGRSEKYVQNFYGDLAGLQFNFSKITRSKCHRNCSQRLEIASQGLTEGQSFALGKNKTAAIIRAPNLKSLRELLDRVRYIEPEHPIPLSVLLNGTVVCDKMPKTVISELWLRATSGQVNHGSPQEGNLKSKMDEKSLAGKGLIKTTPGFVYSGWMVVILVTLTSGLALLAVSMIVNNRYASHQRCPTEEMEWDDLNYHVTLNPLRHSSKKTSVERK